VAWIEIDLGAPTAVGTVRLVTAQDPPGPTDHRVAGRASPGAALLPLGTLAGTTADYQVLELTVADTAPAVQVIRVTTVVSPSWVAWREIEIEAR
jgi:hypothetical protein